MLGMASDTLGATKLRTMLRFVTFRLGDAYAEAEPVLLEQVAKLDTDQTVVLLAAGPNGSTKTGANPSPGTTTNSTCKPATKAAAARRRL